MKTATEDTPKEKAPFRDAMQRNPAAPSFGLHITIPNGANGVRITHNMQGAELVNVPPEDGKDYLTHLSEMLKQAKNEIATMEHMLVTANGGPR